MPSLSSWIKELFSLSLVSPIPLLRVSLICIQNLQLCLIFFPSGGDVSFFFFGRHGLSAGIKKWQKRDNRDAATQFNICPPHRLEYRNERVCCVSRSVSTILLSLAVSLKICHPPVSLFGCSLNTLSPLNGSESGRGCPLVILWFFLFFFPSCRRGSLLSFLEPPRGLWIFPLWLSKSGCHSFLRNSLGLLLSFASSKRESTSVILKQ